MVKNSRTTYIGLAGIILIYLTLTQFYNAAIPFSKGPDELTHFLYALFIGQHGRLPNTLAERDEVGTRAYLPPFYHIPVGFMMAITQPSTPPKEWSATNTGLFPRLKVTWEPATRQLIDIVLPRATLVRTEDERPPFRGEYLAWVVGRWVSTILSAGTIILTFFTVRILLPHRSGFALLAAAFLAFIPMFLFISAVLNDDNMVGLVMAGYLLLFVWFLRGKDAGWLYVGMGLLIGLGITTKYTAGLIALNTAITIGLVRLDRKWSWGGTAQRVALVWLAVILSAGWWFIWNEIRFNEVAEHGLIAGALKPFSPEIDPTATRLVSFFSHSASDPGLPSNGITGNFWDWSRRTFETTWALTVFGVPPYPTYWPIITLLAGLTLLSLGGLWFTFRQGEATQKIWIIAFSLHFILVLPLPLLRFFLTYRINDTAQGRHLFFPAAPVIVLLLLTGWDYWIKPTYKKRAGIMGIGVLLLWATLHGWYLWRAYPSPLPVRTTPGPQMQMEQPAHINFGGTLLLTGYQTQLASDEMILQVDLLWQSLAQAEEDYRTEITLIDGRGQPQLRWISQPADGRFPVRAWQPGDIVRDTLQIPLVGLSPGDYDVQLRLLGWSDPLPSKQGGPLILTSVTLNDVPQLAGTTLWRQGKVVGQTQGTPSTADSAVRPSHFATYRYRSTIPVTLSQPRAVTLMGPDGKPRFPITDINYLRTFMVDYDWPTGDYQLQLDGKDSNLGLHVENFDTRDQGWNFNPPAMMYSVQANFANKIELLGYDLPVRRVEAGGGIPLLLYWQSLTRLHEDYTIFVQLLDVDQNRRGGYDRFPRENYNTYLWVPGEVVDDGFAVPVDADALDGTYTIRIGLYRQENNQAIALPLVQEGETLDETSVVIGPIKVGEAPAGIVKKTISPEHPLDINLGETIALRGYDLSLQEMALEVGLYWQSLTQTDTDYTVFIHLYNEMGEIVAQLDGPPAAGKYPTSIWDSGEFIPDEFTLSLPPDIGPGKYELVVGLYDPRTGTRLLVPGTVDNSVLLTKINLN